MQEKNVDIIFENNKHQLIMLTAAHLRQIKQPRGSKKHSNV